MQFDERFQGYDAKRKWIHLRGTLVPLTDTEGKVFKAFLSGCDTTKTIAAHVQNHESLKSRYPHPSEPTLLTPGTVSRHISVIRHKLPDGWVPKLKR